MLSYFPLKTVLTEALEVSATTKGDLPLCGFLSSRRDRADLPRGSCVLAPLWLLRACRRLNLFSVQQNGLVSDKTRAQLQLEPRDYAPECGPGDFYDAADAVLALMSKKQAQLVADYRTALGVARRERVLGAARNVTAGELQRARAREDAEARMAQIMCVRFK